MKPGSDLELLARLRIGMDYMDANFASPLVAAEVAARTGYSRFHFLRCFRTAYGETPGLYLSRRRIERAKHLLRDPSLSITTVAFEVGFTSVGTFCTTFKRMTGMTAGDFRRLPANLEPQPPACFVQRWSRPS